MNPNYQFIFFTVIAFAFLFAYIFIRANWLEREKAKYPACEYAVGHDARIMMFWVWDIRKFIGR